jgi:hypothetical protein
MNMQKVSDAYPYPWLRVNDLQGAQRMVTVDKVEWLEFDTYDRSGKEWKYVLSFVGKQKRFILNRNQAQAMGLAAGDDPNTWPGQKIYLQPVTVKGKASIGIVAVATSDGDEQGF